MLEKAYGAELLPAVGLYNPLWQLDSLAQKLGIESKGVFSRLKREIRSFSSERTALVNGANGERFYLLQDESALRQHDETHLFKVGIDGDKLADDLDEALGLLSKEPAKIDAYAGTYSPDRSERDFDRLGKDPFHKMGRNRVLRDDSLLRNLDARPFGPPDWLLLQVVSLMQGPLNEQSFKKIGQNRFHDPAPQTRGFLTGTYYAAKWRLINPPRNRLHCR